MQSAIRISPASPLISTFAMGTIAWGTKTRGDDLDRLYDAFRTSGGNVFDTAHVYAFWMPDGLGASERALGEIVRRRNDRENVILTTKGGHPSVPKGYVRPDQYLSPELIESDICESLGRLGVDTIDLYYLHRDDARVPVGEIIDLLNEQIARGHIRQIGASNWTTARIIAANEYATKNQKIGFVANSPRFSLANPNAFPDPTVPPFGEGDAGWHKSTGLTLFAWSSTANGFFASNGKLGGGWQNAASSARLFQVNRIAGEIGAGANQVALAWLLHQKFPVVPILGTTNLEHLIDGLEAADVRLTDEQVRSLTRAV